MDIVKQAEDVATAAHGNQMYGEIHPYSKHLKDMVDVLVRFGFTQPYMLASGWLHDSVEDTQTTLVDINRLFGQQVADLVHRVTNEPGINRKERHLKTYPKIQASPDATTLKLADRIANVEYSIETEADQLNMYRKEYEGFKAALCQPGIHDAMWRHLDFLIGDTFDLDKELKKMEKARGKK